MTEFRLLTPFEKGLIRRVLAEEPSDYSRALDHLDTLRAKAFGKNGSLEFEAPENVTGIRKLRAEATAPGPDGADISALLFGAQGYLIELELFRVDGEAISELPPLESFQVIIL